jgi:NADH:ubiquinone oxidoreductase subunit 2 (subunit N)
MFMRDALDKTRLPLSIAMRVALGVTALATVFIGVFPEPFIRAVNWSLNIAQTTPIASLMR